MTRNRPDVLVPGQMPWSWTQGRRKVLRAGGAAKKKRAFIIQMTAPFIATGHRCQDLTTGGGVQIINFRSCLVAALPIQASHPSRRGEFIIFIWFSSIYFCNALGYAYYLIDFTHNFTISQTLCESRPTIRSTLNNTWWLHPIHRRLTPVLSSKRTWGRGR